VPLTRSVEVAAEALRQLVAIQPPYPQVLHAQLTGAVRELLALREAARQRRAWGEADHIRQALMASGIRVEDTRTACHATSEFPPERGLPAVNVSLVKT